MNTNSTASPNPRNRSGNTPEIDPDIRVAFILSPRFTIIAFASFVDCLRHAADEADQSRQIYCSWSVVAPNLEPIEASCGIQVIPQQTFPDPTIFDYIVIVGGLLPVCLEVPEVTYDYLRAARACNVSVVGLCTGSFILAKAGLLDGRKCAVHFEHRQQLVDLFPGVIPVTDRVYFNDRGIITCPGGTAPLDLAFTLIEEHCGKARAVKGITSLLVDKHRAVHHMPHRPYDSLTACGDWRVEQSVALMQRNISKPFGIDVLAHRLGTSARELNRAFEKHAGDGPATIWRKIRLAHGHWLLLNSARAVTQIALECGFADTSHFSRWFKTTYGEGPKIFREHRRRI
ncbi:MAG: GlxA family transcriptional regulator [Gammaproteobacteria bacterium]|nr:GlxA family transcriptional regulator [Gammaproteobacteria bacterium]